jgi:hypothetical protein
MTLTFARTLPVSVVVALDARVLSFAILLAIVTSVLFGLAPAWFAAAATSSEALRAGGRAGNVYRVNLKCAHPDALTTQAQWG